MKFVCISDTHRRHAELTLPAGDVLIHAGDFTDGGEEPEVTSFTDWLISLTQFRWKVVIAGNHERTFDTPYFCRQDRRRHLDEGLDSYSRRIKAILNNERLREDHGIVYLEDAQFAIPDPAGGEITMWGSPWQPAYANFAFNLPRGGPDLREVVRRIPADIDILVSHGPPFGMLDTAFAGKSFGCSFLAERLLVRPWLQRLRSMFTEDTTLPKCYARVHVFGHIHSGYGMEFSNGCRFINASMCGDRVKGLRAPITFDLSSSQQQL